MMKVTMRTSREDIVKALGVNAKLIQRADKNVYDQMVYTSKALKKDEKSVTKKDLSDLLKEVMRVLGDKFIDPFVVPANAEEKKPVKAETTAPAKKTPAKKESSLKTAKKTKETPQTAPVVKQEAPKTAEPVKKDTLKESPKYLAQGNDFPNSLTIEGETYWKASDLQDMKSIYKALEDNTELVFAFYWNRRQIVQFRYFDEQLPCPKSFPDNLDLCTLIYASDAFKVAYAVSMYTEVNYRILPVEVPTFEDSGVRISNGIEYEIYRKIPKELLEKWKAEREARHTPGTVVKSKKGDTIGVIADKKESKKLTGTPKKMPEAVPAGTVDEKETVHRKTKKTITKK